MTATEAPKRLYPWPLIHEDETTRDYLVRHFAEQYQLCNGALDVYNVDSSDWHEMVVSMSTSYGLCLLLSSLPADTADDIAQRLVGDLNDGGVCGEWVWQWIDGWGMDSAAIAVRGADMARIRLAKRAASSESSDG